VAGKLDAVHIASGDLFRQALERGTDLGLRAKAYMEQGALVPDEITIQMVLARLAEPDGEKGAILDGFPRNLAQSEALDAALGQQHRAIDRVVYIKVDEQELLQRLSGRRVCRRCQKVYSIMEPARKISGRCEACGGELYQRPDDTAATVKRRLEVYFAETAPLIDYYAQQGRLLEIDGQGNIDEVTERILAGLGQGELATR
jgi:adenylate kinase